MRVGNSKAIGNHEDLATCIEYSEETRKVFLACNPLHDLQKTKSYLLCCCVYQFTYLKIMSWS